MPESTENKYRLQAICPKCGELEIIEITVNSMLAHEVKPKETEGKDNAGTTTTDIKGNINAESADVRPNNPKGETGSTDSVPEPTDSGKSKANKRAGSGKAK